MPLDDNLPFEGKGLPGAQPFSRAAVMRGRKSR